MAGYALQTFLDLGRTVGDFFLPRPCLGCPQLLPVGAPGWLCEACWADLPLLPRPRCPRCGAPFRSPLGGDHLCQACLRQPPPFTRARAAAFYDGLVLEAIHRLKYHRQLLYARFLGHLLRQEPDINAMVAEAELLIPVPLHPSRLRQRGFNQALLLARQLAPRRVAVDVLRRRRYTRPQVGLTSQERLANVKGAFAVPNQALVTGKKVILVDDVYTTGATISECARVLRRAQAARIEVITVARVGYA